MQTQNKQEVQKEQKELLELQRFLARRDNDIRYAWKQAHKGYTRMFVLAILCVSSGLAISFFSLLNGTSTLFCYFGFPIFLILLGTSILLVGRMMRYEKNMDDLRYVTEKQMSDVFPLLDRISEIWEVIHPDMMRERFFTQQEYRLVQAMLEEKKKDNLRGNPFKTC